MVRRFVNFDKGGYAIGVVANSCLWNRLAESFLQQHRIGNSLNPIAGPRLGTVRVIASASASFMFDGHPNAIAPPHGIHLAQEAPRFAGDLEGAMFRRFVIWIGHIVMQPPPGIDRRVSHADFFNLFEVEEPFAIEQRVQRHYPQGRIDGRGRANRTGLEAVLRWIGRRGCQGGCSTQSSTGRFGRCIRVQADGDGGSMTGVHSSKM